MGASLAIALKSLFAVLGFLVTGIVIYTIAIDGFPFVSTPLMAATTIDSYIHVFIILSWVVYKEANWITAILWAVLLVCFRRYATLIPVYKTTSPTMTILLFSLIILVWHQKAMLSLSFTVFNHITIFGYILLQFLKLSTQESLQDPIYFVLLQRQKKTETEQWRKYSLLTARILSLALGSLMLGTLIYILVTYGSPFRRDAFTPWMSATLIDYFVIVIALSVWVAYKESSWLSAAFWIIPIILFGSPITCAYIALQLFSLSSEDPVYLVLFSSHNRYFQGISEAVS